jgi:hypothetical protein
MSFAYNASAVALGGRIVLPGPAIIESQASAALAPTGGVGRQTINSFDYNGIIKFEEASVYVTGSQEGDFFNTLSTVSITKLRVRSILSVDLLFASISSSHAKGADEGKITFEGTSVENLRINGKLIEPRFNHGFYTRYPTHKAMVTGMKENVATSKCPDVKSWLDEEVEKRRTKRGQSFDEKACRAELGRLDVAHLVADRFCLPEDGVPDDHSPIHCSLADDIPGIEELSPEEEADISTEDLRQNHPIRRYGYVVKVAGFGTIKIAEIVIKPGERRFNMFRIELGCPVTGDMTVGSASTNGTELVP